MSIANKNINIAHDNMFRDTKSHYSRVKVSQKPQKTMAHYTDMKNGQRCESDNNSHSINNGIVQRCDSANNSQSRTSNQTGKAKVRLITQQVLKIDFGLYVLRTRLSLVHMVTNTW